MALIKINGNFVKFNNNLIKILTGPKVHLLNTVVHNNGVEDLTTWEELVERDLVMIENGTITSFAVYGCEGAITIPDTITSIQHEAFFGGSDAPTVILPNSLKNIDYFAFNEYSYMTSINIPASVETIGFGICASDYQMTEITVDENNPIYDSRNNCNAIIETATNKLIQGCKNTIIPSTVTEISTMAFSGMMSDTNDNINMIIPEGVKTIMDVAFNIDYGIKSISLPSTLEAFKASSFSGCECISDIYYNGTLNEWKNIDKEAEDWDSDLPEYTLHCSDGDFSKTESK